jgi:hypothetical protein
MKKPVLYFLALAVAALSADGSGKPAAGIDAVAEDYVRLALIVGAYAPGYIDAYYGPEEWRIKNEDDLLRRGFPGVGLRKRAEGIVRRLNAAARGNLPVMKRLRVEFLRRQMTAVQGEIAVLSGRKFTFDMESKVFYDAVAPVHPRQEFERTIAELEAALPGPGSLQEKVAALRREYVIPAEKLPAVFAAAIAECRRRTLLHIRLPDNESFQARYVKNEPWGAYNWYKGNAFSIIEVNTDLPMTIDGPVRLAAHEGYPGHHVYNALLEQSLVKGKGWIEFTVYPLFSPQSLIAEGTANYGIEMIFPGDERAKFTRDVLYPLAGLDPRKAPRYDRVQELLDGLRYAENEAARGFLDGKLSRAEAIAWMERYALESPERAAKSVSFWNTYRSYVINYNLGRDIVREYVERTAGPDAGAERMWQVFYEILTTPRTPSGLAEAGGR